MPSYPISLPFARRLLPLSLAAALLAVPATAPAAEEAVRSFRIAAAPLGQALRQFAGQAGILLSAEGGLTQGKRSGGVNASLSIPQGLQQLLAGTGLVAVQLPDGSYIVRLAPTPLRADLDGEGAGLQVLAPVTVQGSGDDGYRRASSAAASRNDTALRDTPQAVSVVSGELIRDQDMRALADAMRYMPGVGTAAGEGNRDTAVMRGNSSTSDFYLDGMRDDVQYYRDFYNIERVEAIKGPNAMVFGRGGGGGIINRATKQPQWTNDGEASVSLGAWRNRRAALDVQQVFGGDVAVRVNAMAENSDSFRQGVDVRRSAINPVLAWRLSPRTSVVASYEHFRDDRVTDRGLPSYQGRPFETDPSTFFGIAGSSPSWAYIDALGVTFEHDLGGGASLRNRTRLADYDKLYQNAFPGPVSADGGNVTVLAYNSATRRRNLFNQTDVEWTVAAGTVQHRLTAGLELGRQTTDNLRNTGYFTTLGDNVTHISLPTSHPVTDLPVTFRPSATDADNHGVADTAALYLQDQLRFSARWQVVAGMRYERFAVDFVNKRTGARIARTDAPWSPRAALIYQPVPALSLYASVSQSFLPRAGEQLASLTPSNAVFEPERFRNVELGVKWEVTPLLSASAAVYRLERSNVAVTDPADTTRAMLVDGQRSEGLELDVNGKVQAGWSIAGGYAWQRAVLTATQATTAVEGATVAHVPRHSLSLWNRYDFSPAWGAGLGVIARSAVYASVSNTVVLPGFTRVDGAVYFKPQGNFQLQLNMENLFNKKYYASAHSNDNIAPGSPRALRMTALWRF
ncbi:TonB-dependent siderophore receptor [Janthinobacterium sp. EB271-G4-7A]|uniref:TonB-dependent siderophore receptor n=1 Tax=Janthinobacterium sp. EB271-G4-7A TaxID=2775056 RepID=UPI001E40E2E6|nr:TonB-dependent siderophore receptor [Janthinobacterium sp. EB271-G4-7A]MCC7698168.1 TonB-dependent siderophore receptor [Janthinobacterium sp. EB271-G4-7A]